MKLQLLVLSMALPLAVSANTLYKCTDRNGGVLLTNQKPANKSCVVLSHEPVPVPSSSTPASRPRASATPTPRDFPRVSASEQKTRDNDRKAILDRELESETRQAERARAALQEPGTHAADKQQALRDTLALHERNIEALRREIGNLR